MGRATEPARPAGSCVGPAKEREESLRASKPRDNHSSVCPTAYLAWAFERLGTHRDLFDLPLEALTPAAFKKTLG